jgi:hypothetical protein
VRRWLFGWQPFRQLAALCTAAAVLALGGCASQKGYTTDDGRTVNPVLLENIRAYGAGERSLRPAIARSAALKDPACDKQWELPFSVASSQAWADDERVAWVRALGVDERLSVVAAIADGPLQLGERIAAVAQKKAENDAEALVEALAEQRDAGKPFKVTTSTGRVATVQPFEVCRGYTRLAPPNTPDLQDYHWLLTFHPLQLAQTPLTDDEALWTVLWTQGLSEEGGARMKTYHYGVKVIGTLYNLATLASGLKGAALAADAAIKVAKQAAQQVATELAKKQIVDQARAYATDILRDAATDAAERVLRTRVVSSMQQATLNRGSLSGVSRVGATVFDRADRWAFERMQRLSASPLAGVALHQKMAEAGRANNVFVFDTERLALLNKLATTQGLEAVMASLLKGLRPDLLDAELGAMPLASAADTFSYDDASDSTSQPFAHGLVAALLEMPVASKGKK